jgi:hypothetical protein
MVCICAGWGDQSGTAACCRPAAATVGGCEGQDEQNLLGSSPSDDITAGMVGWQALSCHRDCWPPMHCRALHGTAQCEDL